MSKKKNPPSDSNHTIHSAWIGFAGVVIAAIIAAAVAFYSRTPPTPPTTPAQTPTTVINQSVGDGNQGTVNQSGGDIYNAQ